jgi:hypothetical protein
LIKLFDDSGLFVRSYEFDNPRNFIEGLRKMALGGQNSIYTLWHYFYKGRPIWNPVLQKYNTGERRIMFAVWVTDDYGNPYDKAKIADWINTWDTYYKVKDDKLVPRDKYDRWYRYHGSKRYRRYRHSNYYTYPKTLSEMKANQLDFEFKEYGINIRSRRQHLPTAWDDMQRQNQRSWKEQRKTQYKRIGVV